MSALKNIIEAEIAAHGPMPVSRYMELCLGHPEHGYYMRQQPFGAGGDFTTAPEISQMFGELIGLWLVHMWQQAGAPARFTLLELGPGRGTLMADILRAARLAPAFLQAARVYLMESSPRLRAVQRGALGEVQHIERLGDLPEGPVFAVANEFFDALPIRQFVKNDFGWQERLVGPGLVWALSDTGKRPELDAEFPDLETGRMVETNEAARAISHALTQKISAEGGVMLAVDYGEFDGVGDTLQAVHNHKTVNVFEHIGKADLTAHVRFKNLVQNGVSHKFTTQGAFLTRLGIAERAKALGGVDDQMHRLADTTEMGDLFKVLAVMPKGYGEIAGFET